MAREPEFTEDEELVIEEVAGAVEAIAEWLHVTDEEDADLPAVDKLSDDARCELLKTIYEDVGEEAITEIIQILQDSLDSEMRCPK